MDRVVNLRSKIASGVFFCLISTFPGCGDIRIFTFLSVNVHMSHDVNGAVMYFRVTSLKQLSLAEFAGG